MEYGKVRKTAKLDVRNPFASLFPRYKRYFYGRRALSGVPLGNRSGIGSRAIRVPVTRTQNYLSEEYFQIADMSLVECISALCVRVRYRQCYTGCSTGPVGTQVDRGGYRGG